MNDAARDTWKRAETTRALLNEYINVLARGNFPQAEEARKALLENMDALERNRDAYLPLTNSEL